MCKAAKIQSYHQAAADLHKVAIELRQLTSPEQATVRLEQVAERLGRAADLAAEGDISVHASLRSAHSLALEAVVVLSQADQRLMDEINIAASLVMVARYRAQQAVEAAQRTQWQWAPSGTGSA